MQSENSELFSVYTNRNRLTRRIFSYLHKLKISVTCFKETEKDVEELQITPKHQERGQRAERKEGVEKYLKPTQCRAACSEKKVGLIYDVTTVRTKHLTGCQASNCSEILYIRLNLVFKSAVKLT